MRFLLDTTAFSDLMTNHPTVDARLTRIPREDEVLLCTITRGEVAYGIARMPYGKRQQDLQRRAEHMMRRFRCEAVPPEAADVYARVKLAAQRKGITLGDNDLWIASTAISIGATLVTRDNDFKGIDGLVVEDWTT